MLDRLAPELLLPILRLVAPLDVGGNWTNAAYKQRRSTLRSLCLVNKQLCALAQPMLPEQFEAKNESAIKLLRLKQRRRPLGKEVKRLLIMDEAARGPNQTVQQVLRACPFVEDLRIERCHGFSLQSIAGLKDLKHLVLLCCIAAPSRIPVFPGVLDLSLHLCTMSKPMWADFLSSTHFPSLKNLDIGLSMVEELFRDSCVPRVEDALAKRLDCLMLTEIPTNLLGSLFSAVKTYSLSASLPFSPTARNLAVRISLPGLPDSEVQQRGMQCIFDSVPFTHLRLDPHTPKEIRLDAFSTVSSSLKRLPTVKSVEIPLSLHPSSIADPSLRSAAAVFLETCRSVEISVVWYEPADIAANSSLSPEYLRWTREKRGAEAGAAEAQ
ncbi:hypothetical protein JCM8097_004067 [Rhodosporidiobolus ruineniae]